jgi:hypothetical protein
MGGQGGAAVKPTQYVSDFQQNPQDYYSSTSCVNCHSSPPETTCIQCHKTTPETYLPRPSPCSAEFRWPKYLETPIRDIDRYPWWIHQNFLTTQMKKEDFPVTPKKLDLGVVVLLKEDAKVPLPDIELRTQKNALISFKPILSGEAQDFNFLLENQTLFSTQNVSAHQRAWYDPLIPQTLIQTLSVRDGHPLLTAAVGVLNLFRSRSNPLNTEFDLIDNLLPNLPVAYQEKTGETRTWAEFGALSKEEKRKYHRIEIFYEAARSARLPERIRLHDLYHLIRDLQEASRKAKENGAQPSDFSKLSALISSIQLKIGMIPEQILDPNVYIKFRDAPGANDIQLDLQTDGVMGLQSVLTHGSLRMDEVFLPGIANFGSSQVDFKLSMDSQGQINAVIDHIDSEIRPMGYAKGNPRKIGLIELKTGTIRDGEPTSFKGLSFQPGIRMEGIGNDQHRLQANLNLDMTLAVPLLGEIRLTGPVLIQTNFKKVEVTQTNDAGNSQKETRYLPIPESTVVALPGLEIKWGNFLIPSIIKGTLLFTDIPSLKTPTHLSTVSSGFFGKMQADQIQYGMMEKGDVELSLPINRGSDGLYDISGFRENPQFQTVLQLLKKDKTQIDGEMNLLSEVKDKQKDYKLRVSLEHRDESGMMLLAPLIDKGLFTYSTQNDSSTLNKTQIDFSADSLWLDPVGITSPKFNLGFVENQTENGLLDWTIHSLQVSGNPWGSKGPSQGIFRGPFWIKTLPPKDQNLIVRFDSNERLLDVKNLKVGFDFKQVAIPGLAKATKGALTGLDVDGRVQGFWSMDTESYKGRGQIIFQGDKEGDLHLRDKKGQRIEGRLNPDDPDRLYEIPLLADTTWTIDRIDGVDFDRERINGHFILKTLIDWMAFQAMGIYWNEHDQVEFTFDHLPYTNAGFDRKISEYFQSLSQETKAPKFPKGARP